jgi:hypothetical protein
MNVGVKTESFATAPFILYGKLYRVDITDGRFLPGVKPLSNDSPIGNIVTSEEQTAMQRLEKLVLRNPEINGKVAKLEKHGAPLPVH